VGIYRVQRGRNRDGLRGQAQQDRVQPHMLEMGNCKFYKINWSNHVRIPVKCDYFRFSIEISGGDPT